MKYQLFLAFLLSLSLAPVALAQNGAIEPVVFNKTIFTIIKFLNDVVIPFLLAIGFFMFVVGVIRYFVIGGADPDSQKQAKTLAIYSVGAFVFILTFWALVNLVASGVGLVKDPSEYSVPDYMRDR